MKKNTRRRKPAHDTAEILEARIAPATFTVMNLNDSGTGSLRDAVVLSNTFPGADTIVFDKSLAGKIVLTGGQLSITQPLTVKGPGAGKILIDGNANERIFNVDDGTDAKDAAFTISGLSLTNGDADTGRGGAISSKESLTVKGCAIFGNKAESGGGIYVSSNTKVKALISDSVISGNTATVDWGGGLYLLAGGGVSVVNSTVTGNTAKLGGGGAYLGINGNPSIPVQKITVTGSVFTQNSADLSGGGLAIAADSHRVSITKTEISGNTAKSNGGGLYLGNSDTTLTSCTIAGNSTTGVSSGGGGVFVYASTVTLKDSHILGNTAFENGGGIGFDGDVFDKNTLTMNGGNIAGNKAGGNGGGIFGTKGGKVVSKSVNFQGNSASLNGGGISISGTGINATKLEISGGIFRGNSADAGGAVDTAGDGAVVIKSAKFNSNKTTVTDGGALYLRTTTTASITSCLFTGNSSVDDGGAIALGSTGTFTLKSLKIIGNNSADAGGGLAQFGNSVVAISSSTIKNNYSNDRGGGIYVSGNSMDIKTSIITGNVATVGSGGIYRDGSIITLATTTKLFGNTAPANPDKNF